MTRLFDLLLTVVPGIVTLAATWTMFARLRPQDGVIHPFVRKDINCNLVLFAFVAGTAVGLTLLISGLVGIFRPL